ncbi:3'-5' exonuclease [Phlyctema vagabunda]|uniref:3'-5' exonuclease n=1 Tax=Phlyctema vagabunda TaxID=108571 RepID=A0ABR4PY19_9HELO
MLRCRYGASTLGKILGQPATTAVGMTSFGGTSTLVTDAMKSTIAALSRGRPLSSIARSIPTNPSPRTKTWNSSHGIIFGNKPSGSPRTLSTAMVDDLDHNLLIQSIAEDEYVMAKSTSAPLSGNEVANSADAEGEPALTEDKDESEDGSIEVPESTLQFKILEDKFREARDAEPGSAESYWSYTMYRGPDGEQHKVKVHYCRSKHTTEQCLAYFKDQKVLGFDIEWKPEAARAQGPKKNVSLIQIASEDRIALFHIALFAKDGVSDLVAPTLQKIMEDPEITKVGVAIKADCTRLRKFLNIEAKGIFELSHLYRLIKYSDSKEYQLINKRLVSLATQVQEHLQLPMFKASEVRSSDWSQPLQINQIVYAASDSYAGVQLYSTMNQKRLLLDPPPPLPYHAELNRPIRLADGVAIPTDTALEELEADDPPTPAPRGRPPKLSSKNLASAAETLELDPGFEISATKSPAKAAAKSSSSASKKFSSPVVQAAAQQMEEYRATHPKNRAAPSNLRAYFIWHENKTLSIEDIAALLRDVPLQTMTVVNYILEAIKLEKLPYDAERLRDVLDRIPKEVTQGRYKMLAKGVEKFDKQQGGRDRGEEEIPS